MLSVSEKTKDLPVTAEPPEKVRVSVIMLTFNRPQFIGRAIESVIDQDFEDWELIIVHDGPNLSVCRVVEHWQSVDRRIRYLRREEGGNIANGINFGLRHSRGEYIAILDDDDYWSSPDKLTKQITFLDENQAFSACGTGVIVVDESDREKVRYYRHAQDQKLKRWALLANPIHHSTSMYRREAIFRCGLYDESLPGFQDWDVFLKLGTVGKLYNIPQHMVCYRIWNGASSFKAHHANTRCAMRIISRHRKSYKGFSAAFAYGCMHYIYARMPRAVKAASFSVLSRAKKVIFSERPIQSKAAVTTGQK